MPPPLIQSPPPGVNLGMRSKLAVGVYVHSFQNLDLLTQGWYALRCFVRRARDQESGLMDEVIEVPVPVESAAERVPADSSLDWIAIRAPPLTIKERRRREARQRYKMNRNSKAKGCLERAIEDADSSDSSDDEDEPSYTTRAFKIQWACEKFCVEHFNQFILPVNLNALKDDDDARNGYSSDSSSDSDLDEDAAPDDASWAGSRGSNYADEATKKARVLHPALAEDQAKRATVDGALLCPLGKVADAVRHRWPELVNIQVQVSEEM